jgi:recombinational DNA repair protein (RecF pathway)
LPIVTQAETIERFGDLNLEFSVATLAFQLGEIILELLSEGEPHTQIFDHFSRTLSLLTQADPQEAESHVEVFQRFLLEDLGYGQPEKGSPLDYIEQLLDRRLKSSRLTIL